MKIETLLGAPVVGDLARRKHILDAALQIFIRFGFRKTTMDDVARMADISRQGLYFLFANKEDLFRETMRKTLDDGLVAASARLDDNSLPIGERLVLALDDWMGRFVGIGNGDASDLFERSGALLGSLLADYSAVFQARLTQAVADAGLAPPAGKGKGKARADAAITADDIADTVFRSAAGWKHALISQQEFVARMRIAVRVILGER